MSKSKQIKKEAHARSKTTKRKATLTSPPHPRWFKVAKVCLIIVLWLALSLTIISLAWKAYYHKSHDEHKHNHHSHNHQKNNKSNITV